MCVNRLNRERGAPCCPSSLLPLAFVCVCLCAYVCFVCTCVYLCVSVTVCICV